MRNLSKARETHKKRRHGPLCWNIEDILSTVSVEVSGRLHACVLLTTRKMKTVLPSLKSKISDDLKSRVIYEITLSGCKSSYVGHTTRHLMTRLAEHARKSSPVGNHLENSTGDAPELYSRVLDQCEDPGRLLTLEALYIARRQPKLKQREDYRQGQPISKKS